VKSSPLLLALVIGCAPAAEAPAPAPPEPADPPAAPAPDAPAADEPSPIQFQVRYPATLLYALDGAAGRPNHDLGYRKWLLGDEQPAWLTAYAERRSTWNGGGSDERAPAFDTCGWTTDTLEALIECVEGVVSFTDRPIAVTALREADARLRPRWEAVSAPSQALVPQLERAAASPEARELVVALRHAAQLPPGSALAFDVVLVVKPPGPSSRAHQQGPYLVHEVGSKETAGGLLSVTFHEIMHLASALSPVRDETERGFMALGDSGKVAANIWDEAVATAFGNGLAAEKLDPAFRPDASFYNDTWIDTMGRAIYLDWKAGRDIQLGPSLAPYLTSVADRVWPAAERQASRYLWYCDVRADDAAALKGAFEGISTRSAYQRASIDDALAPEPRLPPWATRVVLVTKQRLADRPALRTRLGIPDGSWTAPLEATNAAVFRHDDPDGALVLVFVAETVETLRGALPTFARSSAMVSAGWTSLAVASP